ncbi:MAG: prolyl oligopeptidase family serine peptidase [Planctomycetia bacterium]|nr:prolyl oligopeptidase family serine peptidase [Planctomycetia bacterium]
MGLVAVAWIASGVAVAAAEQAQTDGAEALRFDNVLVLPPVGFSARSPIRVDFLEAQMIESGWAGPKEGDEIKLQSGAARWEKAALDERGAIQHNALRGGYLFATVKSPKEQVMLLEVSGHTMCYFNGEPRTGDPYGNGLTRLPVLLREGKNRLLARCGRGNFSARLTPPQKPVFLDLRDNTLGDIVNDAPAGGAVLVVNARNEPLDDVRIETAVGGGVPFSEQWQQPLDLTPLSLRKVPFQIDKEEARKAAKDEVVEVELRLVRQEPAGKETLDTATIKLNVVTKGQPHGEVYASSVDGSVQSYYVIPASQAGENLALVLTLHGAGVDAPGQARSYGAKSWAHVVAPTNRRPFGFDWEDWGRIDALEVLESAQESLQADPRRTYLTGHSMGGHGVWQVGALYPDRFAAIGPSAGWISFETYGGRRQQQQPSDAVTEILRRSAGTSDTAKLAQNYAMHGVYVLHGTEDDNVPVGQARAMRQILAQFHRDFAYYERPGAGHWWDGPDGQGADCVDWPVMFDFFQRREIPKPRDVTQINFSTANPAVSHKCHWLSIEAQIKQGEASTVDAQFRGGDSRRFTVKTTNVARFTLDGQFFDPHLPIDLDIDGQNLKGSWLPNQPWTMTLARHGDSWSVVLAAPPALKGPHRHGPFKEAFRNYMLFVYGTKGNEQENAWALSKARFDAETFWYRGNGSVDVVPDTQFESVKSLQGLTRNVILYGNADTNAAWEALLKQSPVQVRRDGITVGQRELAGGDLACSFIRPHPKSDQALVGVVAGTGPAGNQAAIAPNYFISGAGYPDLLVYGTRMLREGTKGVRVAGFFGNDWSIEQGEFVWSDEPPQETKQP